MVQEFHVLKCFSCQTYQVQQVKKINKWSCKMCGEKQSVVKEFLRGGAVDCRRLVQTLNAQHGENVHKMDQTALSSWEQTTQAQPHDSEKHAQHEADPQVSRWKKYMPQPEEGQCQEEREQEEEESDWGCYVNRKQCHGNSNVRKRKRRGWNNEEENCFSYPDWKQSRLNHSQLNQTSRQNQTRPDQTKPNHTRSNQTRQDQYNSNLSRSHQTRTNQTRPNQTSSDQTNATAPSRWSQFLDPPRPGLGDPGFCGGSGLEEKSLPSDWLKSPASLSAAKEWTNRKSESSHTTTTLHGTDASCQQALPTTRSSQLIGSLFNTGDDFDVFDVFV